MSRVVPEEPESLWYVLKSCYEPSVKFDVLVVFFVFVYFSYRDLSGNLSVNVCQTLDVAFSSQWNKLESTFVRVAR